MSAFEAPLLLRHEGHFTLYTAALVQLHIIRPEIIHGPTSTLIEEKRAQHLKRDSAFLLSISLTGASENPCPNAESRFYALGLLGSDSCFPCTSPTQCLMRVGSVCSFTFSVDSCMH